jgi:hypothetical protein
MPWTHFRDKPAGQIWLNMSEWAAGRVLPIILSSAFSRRLL